MSYNNYIEKILRIKGVTVEKVKSTDTLTEIYIKPTKKYAKCPCCGNKTSKIHDYRRQKISDMPAFGKKVVLVLHKRRFKCSCGKKFTEIYSFLPKYYGHTQRLMLHIIEELKQVTSLTDVSKPYDMSASTVIRVFDVIRYPLYQAHYLKEEFYKILKQEDSKTAKQTLSYWILQAQCCKLTQFNSCAQSICNWSPSICNNLEYRNSNGFTEGCNNKIKGLKRNAYGYRNFKRFRNRILHIFSHQYTKMAAA